MKDGYQNVSFWTKVVHQGSTNEMRSIQENLLQWPILTSAATVIYAAQAKTELAIC